jgi:hypothetical protein
MQSEAQSLRDPQPGAGHRDFTIEGAMAHAQIKSRMTLMKYVELLNIQLKRPGVGSRRFYITWEDAERVRQLREDPLRLDELRHPPREERGSDLDA